MGAVNPDQAAPESGFPEWQRFSLSPSGHTAPREKIRTPATESRKREPPGAAAREAAAAAMGIISTDVGDASLIDGIENMLVSPYGTAAKNMPVTETTAPETTAPASETSPASSVSE